MTIQEVISRKRDGGTHTREELRFLAQAAAGQADVADYQFSAWLMAAYINGLDDNETLWLTLEMADSGVIDHRGCATFRGGAAVAVLRRITRTGTVRCRLVRRCG